MTLIRVTIYFKGNQRRLRIGNARMVMSDDGMLYVCFSEEKKLGFPLRDILQVECEPAKV
uniref:Uncharacterized protein n=1 Tax=viral metagenome TaxID=1070528 RepID=A0A6M3IYV1_9ZZZZ